MPAPLLQTRSFKCAKQGVSGAYKTASNASVIYSSTYTWMRVQALQRSLENKLTNKKNATTLYVR
eukprot:4507008-Amphidinium_carterae.1